MAGEEHQMKLIRLATVWLSGCSGCHMSLLNTHQDLLDILALCELVYSPLIDIKEYPHGVDIALVEGAVGNEDNRAMAQIIRQRTAVVISLGDCAVNGNVSALRNPGGLTAALERSYGKTDWKPELTRMEAHVLPLHQVIRVDAFIPGCPPDSTLIRNEIVERLHNPTGKK
jgi:NAD-reducing hydrogenase small subunit